MGHKRYWNETRVEVKGGRDGGIRACRVRARYCSVFLSGNCEVWFDIPSTSLMCALVFSHHRPSRSRSNPLASCILAESATVRHTPRGV